jgi:hypothetical protein
MSLVFPDLTGFWPKVAGMKDLIFFGGLELIMLIFLKGGMDDWNCPNNYRIC